MKSIANAVIAIILVCAFAAPVQAAEGFLMVERTVTGTTTSTSRVQLERERMRAEMTGSAGETSIVVFDGPQQVLRIISPGRKSYTEMTKADADRIGGKVNAAMTEMQAKIASMPPEQRAKMEAMMARLGGAVPGAAAPAKPEFRRAGSGTVGKWTCDRYEGFTNGAKVSEVCTVDPKTLGLTMADFEISKQVAAFFVKMMPQGVDQLVGVGTLETQGFSGVPVRRVSYRGGAVHSTSEVTEVSRQNFAASTYDVPAGFQKQAIPMR
jgi:hypothetical protein